METSDRCSEILNLTITLTGFISQKIQYEGCFTRAHDLLVSLRDMLNTVDNDVRVMFADNLLGSCALLGVNSNGVLLYPGFMDKYLISKFPLAPCLRKFISIILEYKNAIIQKKQSEFRVRNELPGLDLNYAFMCMDERDKPELWNILKSLLVVCST